MGNTRRIHWTRHFSIEEQTERESERQSGNSIWGVKLCVVSSAQGGFLVCWEECRTNQTLSRRQSEQGDWTAFKLIICGTTLCWLKISFLWVTASIRLGCFLNSRHLNCTQNKTIWLWLFRKTDLHAQWHNNCCCTILTSIPIGSWPSPEFRAPSNTGFRCLSTFSCGIRLIPHIIHPIKNSLHGHPSPTKKVKINDFANHTQWDRKIGLERKFVASPQDCLRTQGEGQIKALVVHSV